MKKLRVKTRIEITTTPKGKIYAEVGDVITVKDKCCEYYYILKVNDMQIFSTWKRKNWIDFKCN